MLAARADQENAVHAQQTAAAAKPLNQGLKGFTAKTPGNRAPKTPYKVPLNDENATYQFGKSALKTNAKGQENGLTVGKAGGKVDKSAFVTPAGPRNRAPLGFKTTNARATAFQTPGPLTVEPSAEKTQPKTLSPRLRRAKVKVHQPEVAKSEENEEPEIEYMPPRGKPLPDYPSDDEFGPEKTFPQFSPENFARGWPSVYFNPVDDNGVSLLEKKAAEQDAKLAAQAEDMLQKAVDKDFQDIERAVMEDIAFDFDLKPATTLSPTKEAQSPKPDPVKPKTKQPAIKSSAPPTFAAKSAASALSRPSKPSTTRSTSAASTTAPARAPRTGILGRKTRPTTTTTMQAPSASHASAAAVSHSTLGYAKGRAASHNLKKPLGSVFKDGPLDSQKRSASATVGLNQAPKSTAPKKDPIKELEELVRARAEAEVEEDPFGGGVSLLELEDEDEEEFQFKMPGQE